MEVIYLIDIRVPATTANIGPGFDCLGIALNLYNGVSVCEIEKGLLIEAKGNVKDIPLSPDNLIYKSMNHVFNITGIRPKGVKIIQEVNIPLSRGLGSSSTCIAAGILAANELIGKPLNFDEMLNEAVKLEGHPDNIAPTFLGGMVASVGIDEKYIYKKFSVSPKFKFIALIPDFKLSTQKARSVLPETYTREDAIYNISRVILLVDALNKGEKDNLSEFLNDKIHQPYRKRLIKHFDDIQAYCLNKGAYGVYLSGAGPTIMVIADSDSNLQQDIKEFFINNNLNWGIKELNVNNEGITILNGGGCKN